MLGINPLSEVFVLVSRQWWATEGDAGEWADQSLFSKSKGKTAYSQVDYKGEGNMFETARDFCLQASKKRPVHVWIQLRAKDQLEN